MLVVLLQSRLRVYGIDTSFGGGGEGGLFLRKSLHSFISFFLFPLHERRVNPVVGITLPACWGYLSRRDNSLFD